MTKWLYLILILLSFNSCKTTNEIVPPWISETPTSLDGTLYSVGGPSTTIQDARKQALESISMMLGVQISSLVETFDSHTQGMVRDEIQQEFLLWSTQTSDSYLKGIREDQRWYDKHKESWYVLLSIDQKSLHESLEITAQKALEREQTIKNTSISMTPRVAERLATIDQLPQNEQVVELFLYYRELAELPYSDYLRGEIEGSEQLFLRVIGMRLERLLTGVDLILKQPMPTLYRNGTNILQGELRHPNLSSLQNLAWLIVLPSGEPIGEFSVDESGKFSCVVPGMMLPRETSSLYVTVKTSLNRKESMRFVSLPWIQFPIRTITAGVNLMVVVDNQIIQDMVQRDFGHRLHDILGASIVNGVQYLPSVTLEMKQQAGSTNAQLQSIRTSATVICAYSDSGSISFNQAAVLGFGVNEEKARLKSATTCLEEMYESPQFVVFLQKWMEEQDK